MKFGEALELLKDGYPVYRESWDGYTYVIKQVNSDITKDIVPKMQSLPNLAKNLILEAAHPSPLSATRGFFGCQHFSKANNYLIEHNLSPIDWQL